MLIQIRFDSELQLAFCRSYLKLLTLRKTRLKTINRDFLDCSSFEELTEIINRTQPEESSFPITERLRRVSKEVLSIFYSKSGEVLEFSVMSRDE